MFAADESALLSPFESWAPWKSNESSGLSPPKTVHKPNLASHFRGSLGLVRTFTGIPRTST